MRIAIFGAGAIGSLLALRLAKAENDVSVVARGEHLDAIRTKGITVRSGDKIESVEIRASDKAAALGGQDLIIVTVKSTALLEAARALEPMLQSDTTLVFAQNGIPWWYTHGLQGRSDEQLPDLSWMDPDEELGRLASRSLGGVIFAACEVAEPGIITNRTHASNKLVVGEFDDRESVRLKHVRDALEAAGIASPPVPSIRHQLWMKLINNMTGTVMGAALGATLADLHDDPNFVRILARLKDEAIAIGRTCCPDLEYIGRTGFRSTHKPSMLQDLERGRPLEIDTLVRAPLEIARRAGVKTPTLDFLGALIASKDLSRAGGVVLPLGDAL